jgi:hypothetical protein
MDLIANSIAWMLTFVASVLGNILAHDICASANRTCAKIIRSAARRLAPFDRESGEQEWLADLYDHVTVREKYQHAIGCFLVAGKMRRQATTVTVAMKFQINGVGTVPLTLNLTSRCIRPAFFAAFRTRYDLIKKVAVVISMLYLTLKFAKSAKASLNPGVRITPGHLKQYKNWEYEAHLTRKGFDLNLSDIFRVMIHDPKRIPEIVKKVSEILAQNTQSAPPA